MSQEKWALISVYNKDGIVEFANRLVDLGWRIVSSGGTAKALQEAGVPVTGVKEMVDGIYRLRLQKIGVTSPIIDCMIQHDAFCSGAILKHRVATLRPEIHGPIISDFQDSVQASELEKFLMPVIDMVVCDFYPLADAIARPGATVESVVELTDIGGPTMVRSAAKGNRIVVCRPQERQLVLQWLQDFGDVMPDHRQQLRARAEFEVARYVMDSARFHGNGLFDGVLGGKVADLAYGENKDQSPASLHACDDRDPLAMHCFKVLAGDPSYISIADGDRALGVMCAIAEAFRANCNCGCGVPAISIACKHGAPCGIGVDFNSPELSINRAMNGDPVAVMGAEFMTNFPVDERLGKLIYAVPEQEQQFVGRKFWGIDVLYAPSVDPATKELLGKKERRRILVNPALADPRLPAQEWMRREVRGGFIRQKKYRYVLDFNNLAKATGAFNGHIVDMIIAWGAAWRSPSNTVALANNKMLLGMGAGQQDRIACVQLCLDRSARSRHNAIGSSAASDGFFPYAKRAHEDAPLEGPELLVQVGCTAVVAPYDGQHVAEVEQFFRQAGVAVAFVPPEHRGFFGH